MNSSISKRNSLLAVAISATCIPVLEAKPLSPNEVRTSPAQEWLNSNSIASNNFSSKENNLEKELNIQKPQILQTQSDCDIFDNPRSVACIGPEKASQPTNKLEKSVQQAATYGTKFVPLLNSNANGSEYSNIIVNDGKRLLVDAGNEFSNSYVNGQIQKIPFFAQTSVSINARSESETSFSIDSLMRLKEMATDDEGDLKTLLFSQARFNTSTSSDGATTNLGLGVRHRPNDITMVGANTFWDYRTTDYSDAHSRLGVGGEYLRNGLELRNNWYMSMTDEKTVTVSGTSYKERVVPGWDLEVGYRFPNNPELAVYARHFNWDYTNTQDNNGLEGAVNWQATPHFNLEAWVSNEVSASKTVANSALPNTDETFFGLRFNWTGQKVNYRKSSTKDKMITQMTQPVRRQYEVLLERSTGDFQNRASGT